MIIRAMQGSDWLEIKTALELAWMEGTKGVVCEDKGEILAAMVCQSWTENSVQTHVLIKDKRALRHGFHYECMRYVFTEADREKMIGIVPSNNVKALKFDAHLGFTKVAVIKDAFNKGVDAVILELHRDNCPYWAEESHSGWKEQA